MFATDEDALIAVNGPERAAMPSFEKFQPAQMRVAFVEFAVKRAADHIGRIECGYCCCMFSREFGVGMMKKQPLTIGDTRTVVQLSSAIWFTVLQKDCAERLEVFEIRTWFGRRDNHFPDFAETTQASDQISERGGIAPNRNDDTDALDLIRTVSAAHRGRALSG